MLRDRRLFDKFCVVAGHSDLQVSFFVFVITFEPRVE